MVFMALRQIVRHGVRGKVSTYLPRPLPSADPAHWAQLASQGVQGLTGATGVTGPAGRDGSSVSLWKYKADPNDSAPSTIAAGRVYWNDASTIDVTQLTVSTLASDGTDISLFLDLIRPGDGISVQDAIDSAHVQLWSVSGWPVRVGASVQIPVSYISAGGNGASNFITSSLQ